MRPGFTARLSEPPACSVFDPRPDALESIVSHSPTTPFGARRVNAQDASSIPASSRSRKLGTAFRSPVTTLSPPLRGQRSRPAPSFPRRMLSRTRSILSSSARFGFEAETGRIPHSGPVVRASLRRSRDDPRPPLPFGLLNPPDQSVQSVSSQKTRFA